MTLNLVSIERERERERSFAMYRCDSAKDPNALYEIVECIPGHATRTMARGVKYSDALLITEALNEHWG